ncbi:MAG TPA: hypothetical protein VN370_02285 [Desulfitobacteriaceae bacterium]|nr:hypothetical protein [Desulfitobacteriaceae bacterium]
MSILAIKEKGRNRRIRKTILVYLIISLLAVAIDNIYAVFGHGVSSAAMTWMFLYPLLGGTLFYLLIELLLPGICQFTGYRVFYNVYNSGIAVLTTGSFLKGILDIAGTNSPYVVLFSVAGWLFIASGLILLTILAVNQKRRKQSAKPLG